MPSNSEVCRFGALRSRRGMIESLEPRCLLTLVSAIEAPESPVVQNPGPVLTPNPDVVFPTSPTIIEIPVPAEPAAAFAIPQTVAMRIVNLIADGGAIESQFITSGEDFILIDPDGNIVSLGTYTYEAIDDTHAVLSYLQEPGSDPADRVTTYLTFTSANSGSVSSTPGGASEATFAFGFTARIEDDLIIVGTPDNDVTTLSAVGDEIQVRQNGVTDTHQLADLKLIGAVLGSGNDSLSVGAGVMGVYATGDSGDDTLLGGNGNDTLNGNAGRDRINAGPGNDRINGNGSRDYLTGGLGDDRIYGSDGNDVLSGLSNVDRLYGGAGDDNMNGGTASDKLYGQDGNDTLAGAAGDDMLDGGEGHDIIDGGAGADALSGQAGNDTLFARDGLFDDLDGGSGTDAARADLDDLLGDVETNLP